MASVGQVGHQAMDSRSQSSSRSRAYQKEIEPLKIGPESGARGRQAAVPSDLGVAMGTA